MEIHLVGDISRFNGKQCQGAAFFLHSIRHKTYRIPFASPFSEVMTNVGSDEAREDTPSVVTSSIDSFSSSSEVDKPVSKSEVAGNRLYRQAKQTQRKIESAREKATIPSNRQLDLATRGRMSRDPSPSSRPRYMQLYEYAKSRQSASPAPEQKTRSQVPRNPTPIEGCDRLYALSKPRQEEGRRRKEEIEQSKIAPPPPAFGTISASEGAKIYDRGMKHLISLEMKRMEAAIDQEQPYESPLVPQTDVDSL